MSCIAMHRPMHIVVGLLALAVSGLIAERILSPAVAAPAQASSQRSGQTREITVERINIVDGDGKARLVIAGSGRFPDPIVRGKPVTRSIRNTAGIVFYDTDGNEAGGIATMTSPQGHMMSGLIFDYGHQPTDGIGIVKQETADGSGFVAGLSVADRRPYKPGDIESSEGVSRIWLANENREAKLELNGTDGRPRIRIGVDAENAPYFQVLDADGKLVRRISLDAVAE
jgi:hypothetical protein